MKGVFNTRPSQPRYKEVWDVNKVLMYLKTLSPVKLISLKDLTLKLVMLIALTNATRVQTVHLLTTVNIKKCRSKFIVQFDGLLKQSRPSYDVSCIDLLSYPPDRRLCVYTVMKEYLNRTKPVRENSEHKLLISFIKPFNAVTRDTIARWIKIVLLRSGIDVKQFGAHSVRAAAVSKAQRSSVPISDIMKTAGWTSESTFAKFYKKEVIDERRFSRAVLQC